MRKTIFFIFLLALLYVIPTVAIQTQINNLEVNELIILYPKQEIFTIFDDIELHFHVLNSSAAIMSTANVDCNAHLYAPDNSHNYEGVLVKDGEDHELVANTSEVGVWAYNLWCNASNGEFGYVSGSYKVTYTGSENVSSNFMVIAGVFAVCVLLLWIANTLSGESEGLRLVKFLIIMVVVFLMLLIPKVALDTPINFSSSLTFYNGYLWFVRIFAIAMTVYVMYEVLKFLGQYIKDRKRREGKI